MIELLTTEAVRGAFVLGLLIGAASVVLSGQYIRDDFRGAK